MTDRFVIVIEADNRRALAAYLKGLADLDRIWPQIESHANRQYEELHAWSDKRRAKREAEYEDFIRLNEQYEAALEALREWERSCPLFRGPRPTLPMRPLSPSYLLDEIHDLHFRNAPHPIERYESIRAELKHMANVAGAALGPFRMTEHQVQEMVAWEDGSRIEAIKREIAGKIHAPQPIVEGA